MSRQTEIVGTLAAAALFGLAAPAVLAQEPVSSDRAGKERRVDFDPTDPAPAPAARRLADQPDAPVPALPGTVRRPAVTRGAAAPPVISSRQIDRFDAIQKERDILRKNPNSLADWVILGELAHEAAMELPASQAGDYFRTTSEAFQKALALDPNNSGLKAAVQFARDQQAHLGEFEAARDAATDVYLAARRRDLGATHYTPHVAVYSAPSAPPLTMTPAPGAIPPAQNQLGRPTDVNASPLATVPAVAPVAGAPAAAAVEPVPPAAAVTPNSPARALAPVPGSRPNDPLINASTPLTGQADSPRAEKSPAVTPAREGAPSTDAANYGTQSNYSLPRRDWIVNRYGGPVYIPFDTPDGPPYTYQQYTNAYFPPGIYNNPTAEPVTLQRYLVAPVVTGGPGVVAPAVAAPAVVTPAVDAAAPAVPNALERQILNRATTTSPR